MKFTIGMLTWIKIKVFPASQISFKNKAFQVFIYPFFTFYKPILRTELDSKLVQEVEESFNKCFKIDESYWQKNKDEDALYEDE